MRAELVSLLLVLALSTIASVPAFRALASSPQNSPARKSAPSLLHRQPPKLPLRPVTHHRTPEPPMYLLQPTFEPFDPSLDPKYWNTKYWNTRYWNTKYWNTKSWNTK